MKQKFFILTILLFYRSLFGGDLNVKNYGAKGDSITDDSNAFQIAINDAVKNNMNLYIPMGKYRIDKVLNVNLAVGQNFIIKGDQIKNKKSILFTNKFTGILEIVSSNSFSTGTIRMSNIEFRGNNVPFNNGYHPYVNKEKYVSAIAIYNLEKVYINNIIIRDFYGEGINLNNYIYSNEEPKYFNYVEIKNTQILDVWGMNHVNRNGAIDDYGDGIYLANVHNALIENNKIFNNTVFTNYLGRSGLTIEYNCFNILVENNYIKGYDRNIHIEGDQGGHIIQNNTIEGSDIAIYVYSHKNKYRNSPIKILNNILSDKDTPYNKEYIPNMTNGVGRALILFKDFDNAKKGSMINENTFTLKDRDNKNNKVKYIDSNSENLLFTNNKIINKEKSDSFHKIKVLKSTILKNTSYEAISSHK
ncbi:glycosyl hydrolase family 28-related protein [Elizabethkingia ursingii]|jgi:hypothetical protein|uniref:Rhamnogalacturonase A/B/Epimerase-like pectate lyase domain-containing protein n=1 Tax=Elizabethkingia ursingii TaxID=1756150 RepID=A0AAJ3NAE3_9FLAO|nr:glycosyl hydrolase family 28-related protein [Elizabethkingia ursingii]AQX08202.1 hypothetical protein BBD34_05885 [Elizabethkingia ursingii]MDR2229251.1 glycoside hydrolase family 55 protein [Flavobacteriaceae bacterium]OPB73442.1 hypothetical protein BAY32_10335 [Elizabethkingia ursingii]